MPTDVGLQRLTRRKWAEESWAEFEFLLVVCAAGSLLSALVAYRVPGVADVLMQLQ